MNRKIEILAPAGALPQLTAAIRCGADAVYFGTGAFNARRNAGNFSGEGFFEAVRLCRAHGVKAYITLNTLVKDSELDELYETVALIAESGADAVIVQDFAAAEAVKKCCPTLALHASTQMAVHNAAGARELEKYGFSRIILARELSIKEIAAVCREVTAETEVFVHGAHCMSASGMCYISSVLGARSGNRGLCAQPCRLNFKAGKREYALSLKDMCLADSVAELVEAGVNSFKIEGRMKRPEYVAAAVTAYANALEGKKADIDTLRGIFSRSGFTDGYAAGKRDLSMFGCRTKDDVVSAVGVMKPLEGLYAKENPLIGIDMSFSALRGKESELVLSDGKNIVSVSGKVPEEARNCPLKEQDAEKSLRKLGSTYFFAKNISCIIDGGISLSSADINALRRSACARLDAVRGKAVPHTFVPFCSDGKSVPPVRDRVQTRYIFGKASQIPDNLTADRIILPVGEICAHENVASRFAGKLCAALPALIYPGSEKKLYEALLLSGKLGAKFAYCENIGAAAMAKKAGFEVTGGALLNVLNSRAASVYGNMGIRDLTLSTELSFGDIRSISFDGRAGIIIYGYMPLMHFRCCPMQTSRGCEGCSGSKVLVDRIGEKFTVLCADRKYSVMHNCVPLYVGDKKLPPVSFVTLHFTKESREEAEKIIFCFENGRTVPGRKTSGLYERELL